MSTTIEPTVGRIVWYRAEDEAIRAAIVVGVNGTFNLNLFVFGYSSSDLEGGNKDSVTHADPAIEPGCKPSWHWMPYQKQQAEKAEAREHDTKQLAVAADRAGDARRVRGGTLDLALRTPGLSGPGDVLAAARAYQAHIDGEATAPAPQPLAERPALGAAFPGYSAMQPHQQRVVDEKCQLAARLANLTPFFDTPMFAGLGEEEKQRLERQEEAMKAYSAVLTERIAAFQATADAALQRVAAEAPRIAQRLISERQASAAGQQGSVRKG